MNILIETISEKKLFLIRLLNFFFKNIYYLRLESKNKDSLFLKLKFLNTFPLPVEEFENIPYDIFKNYDFDPNNLVLKKVNNIYSKKIGKLFLKTISIKSEKKLKLVLKDSIHNFLYINSFIDVWTLKKKKLLFISFKFSDLFLIKKNKNLKIIYLPFDIFGNIFKILIKLLKIHLNLIKILLSKIFIKKKYTKKNYSNEPLVALVLHGDIFYGQSVNKALYKKNLYYSKIYKDFKKENIMHFGYINKKLSDKTIKYKNVRDNSLSLKDYFTILKFTLKSICLIRKKSDLYLICLLIRSLKFFINTKNIFLQYPTLKFALIDYDFLCPKEIILSLMSLGIKTAATQERFISSFYKSQNIILDNYYVASKKINEVIKKNDSILCNNIIPVGLYRADKIINKNNKNNKKLIVALGYQTEETFFESQVNIITSWKSSALFLQDIYKLSNEIKNCRIIIRLKNYEGYKNLFFKIILKKITKKNNIKIDFSSEPEYSYKICSKADLIIARHTSIADECISRDIPTLFHDYTHNMNGILHAAFNYDNMSLICRDYTELLKKTKDMLDLKNNKLKNKFQNIKKKYYFNNKTLSSKDMILNHLNKELAARKNNN